ncbi:MAG: GIY-YIG nuclease family protein [Bryobacterales bacterium]|nr:GIY-YIG nuclease family protein [Bryobacterales bacterium]
MLSKDERKEAIRKFKERKPLLGIFAVRCAPTGRLWIGSSRNLGAAKNRIWFCLSHGSHSGKSLQEEWNTHGESAFHYEALEKLPDDVHPLAISGLLQEKRKQWIAQTGAEPL